MGVFLDGKAGVKLKKVFILEKTCQDVQKNSKKVL